MQKINYNLLKSQRINLLGGIIVLILNIWVNNASEYLFDILSGLIPLLIFSFGALTSYFSEKMEERKNNTDYNFLVFLHIIAIYIVVSVIMIVSISNGELFYLILLLPIATIYTIVLNILGFGAVVLINKKRNSTLESETSTNDNSTSSGSFEL